MEIVTTLDGKTVCNAVLCPPKQNAAGHWELTVQGELFVFELLSDYYGCDFKVGKFILCSLLFIEGEAIPLEDETGIFTMGFAEVMVRLENGKYACYSHPSLVSPISAFS